MSYRPFRLPGAWITAATPLPFFKAPALLLFLGRTIRWSFESRVTILEFVISSLPFWLPTTLYTRHHPGVVVDPLKPVGAMIHVWILIVDPRGHLPEDIRTVPAPLQPIQSLLLRLRVDGQRKREQQKECKPEKARPTHFIRPTIGGVDAHDRQATEQLCAR